MKEHILENLHTVNYVSMQDILIKLIISLLIGMMIWYAYRISSSKVTYSSNFNFALVAMTIITTAVMSVISTNVALSLGMVGALSIIRFRTSIKDPKDAMFIFWSIMVGICCGVSQYVIALMTTAVLFVLYLVINEVKDEKRYVLVIRCSSDVTDNVKSITYNHFKNSRISVENTTSESAEFIYEIKKFREEEVSPYLKELYACPGIECANFILEEEKASA